MASLPMLDLGTTARSNALIFSGVNDYRDDGGYIDPRLALDTIHLYRRASPIA